MHRLIPNGFSILCVTLVPLVLGVLSTQRAMAGPAKGTDMLYVSVSLGDGSTSEQRLSPKASDRSSHPVIGNLNNGRVFQNAELPGSLQFAGLAGTLNLAIDNSGSSPFVDGIELAPRETLRFVAGGAREIRGLQGQISIRLDF